MDKLIIIVEPNMDRALALDMAVQACRAEGKDHLIPHITLDCVMTQEEFNGKRRKVNISKQEPIPIKAVGVYEKATEVIKRELKAPKDDYHYRSRHHSKHLKR